MAQPNPATQKPQSEIIAFLEKCRAQGLTPAQALNRYLASQGKNGIVPPIARPFVQSYLKPIIEILDYFASHPDWLTGKNAENLFRYLIILLQQ
jgi:hypothetical protein